MDKDKIRVIVAVVLCLAVFALQQIFFPPVRSTVPPVAQAQEETPNAVQIAGEIATDEYSAPVAKTTEPVIVEKDDFKIFFDPDTGNIFSVEMKKFTKDESDSSPVFKDPFGKNDYININAGISSGYSYSIGNTTGGTVISFEARNGQIAVKKTYTVSDNDYRVPVTISVQNLTNTPLSVPLTASIGPYLGSGFDAGTYVFTGPIMGDGKNVEKKKMKFDKNVLKKVKPSLLGVPKWGGYTSKYFLLSFMGGSFDRAEINTDAAVVMYKTLTVPTGSISEISDLSLYMGPKIYDLLKSYQNGIQKTVEYGTFSFLAIPMAKVLQETYKFVGNYGISIIILTVIVKILTLPLTLKSTVSMRNMAKLQPEILKLKEKYKDEQQKLQAATMELYKEHKINPLGGCLPLLIQFPIFLALYRTLLVSIELKGAPFFGWIVDLSASDPYYITPVLMGISMFISQRMTPAAGDPMQQKMLMFMPVFFTFLFLKMPSGLVIYWLTNNILTILQQYIINKKTS